MQTRLRAIIVDDERLPRRELRTMLGEFPQVQVLGEAASVPEALAVVRDVEPNVLFLDIQMPGQSGFDLLEQLEHPVRVVFVTAFDAHAIRAFEVNALDYLLKPVTRARLARAVERLTADLRPGTEEPRKLAYDDRIFLSVAGKPRLLKVDAIKCVTGAGDYSEVQTEDGRTALVLKTLKEWEERLPEKYFIRTHRSAIVNMEFIERLEETVSGSYNVFVRGTREPFPMSRRVAARLRDAF